MGFVDHRIAQKLALAVAGLLVAGGGVIGAIVTSSAATAETTLTVIEHGAKAAYSDLAKPGYSRGDLSVFRNKIYDETDTSVVGYDQGLCTLGADGGVGARRLGGRARTAVARARLH